MIAPKHPSAFTLIELLLVIAIIGIMSALIMSAVTNATQDSRSVVSREQQVVLQEALNAWISSYASGTNGLVDAQGAYSNAASALDKLALIKDYLHSETYSHFTNYSTSSQIKSEAMTKAGIYLRFTSWATTNYPIVEMVQ